MQANLLAAMTDEEEALNQLYNVAAQEQTTLNRRLDFVKELIAIRAVTCDLRAHSCQMLSISQYLSLSQAFLSVDHYVSSEIFGTLCVYIEDIGFEQWPANRSYDLPITPMPRIP